LTVTADAPGRTSFGWRHRLARALVALLLLVTCAPVPADEGLSGIFDGSPHPKSINDLTADFDGELDGLLRERLLRLADGSAPFGRPGAAPSAFVAGLHAPRPASWHGRRPSAERAPPAGFRSARYTRETISKSPGHALAPALHPFSITAPLTQRAQLPPDYRLA
jgi:hypothetical protein